MKDQKSSQETLIEAIDQSKIQSSMLAPRIIDDQAKKMMGQLRAPENTYNEYLMPL
jgi:hypothetical protein